MAECSRNRKWSCSRCTYLNFENSQKCTVCLTARDGPLIIESSAVTEPELVIIENADCGPTPIVDDRWSCPLCTYLNCRRTKKCVQCRTDRPLRYASDPSIPTAISPDKPTGSSLSSELNKWRCSVCTYDNWPNANRCTMCQTPRVENISEYSKAIPPDYPHELDYVTERFESTNINEIPRLQRPNEYFNEPLEMYLRKYTANSPGEMFFLNTAAYIGRRDLQMVNAVVDFLIHEGNPFRTLTSFEARLLNATGAFGLRYEKGDSLVNIAKKYDCLDLTKLMKRVNPIEDKLPCVANCAARTRACAKIAQFMAVRNGGFYAQFIAHPHNFNVLKFPMKSTECNVQIMNALMKPAPAIPPSYIYVDCFDMTSSGKVVGRPISVALKNRGGAHSLCDAVFQTMFGICDRFGMLKGALKYTLTRSSNIFKQRWCDRMHRMARDCGLDMSDEDLQMDWEDTLAAIDNESEFLESIHICALAHVVCRPIIVVSMDDPMNMDDLQKMDVLNDKERNLYCHHYEGIYLPVLWGAPPVSRSPLVLGYHNGVFHGIVISEGYYQRDQDVQRFLRVPRTRSYGDSVFRFLQRSELESKPFMAQFISLGPCTAASLLVHRDPHPFLYESLVLYATWANAVQCCLFETPGSYAISQLEREMENVTVSSLFSNASILSAHAVAALKGGPHRCSIPSIPSPKRVESPPKEQPPPAIDSEDDEDDDDDGSVADEAESAAKVYQD